MYMWDIKELTIRLGRLYQGTKRIPLVVRQAPILCTSMKSTLLSQDTFASEMSQLSLMGGPD